MEFFSPLLFLRIKIHYIDKGLTENQVQKHEPCFSKAILWHVQKGTHNKEQKKGEKKKFLTLRLMLEGLKRFLCFFKLK